MVCNKPDWSGNGLGTGEESAAETTQPPFAPGDLSGQARQVLLQHEVNRLERTCQDLREQVDILGERLRLLQGDLDRIPLPLGGWSPDRGRSWANRALLDHLHMTRDAWERDGGGVLERCRGTLQRVSDEQEDVGRNLVCPSMAGTSVEEGVEKEGRASVRESRGEWFSEGLHDLAGLLTPVLQGPGLIRRMLDAGEDPARLLQGMASAGEQIMGLLDDLRMIQTPRPPIPLDLVGLIRGAMAGGFSGALSLEYPGVVLDWEEPLHDVHVLGDRRLMLRAIRNLLWNACAAAAQVEEGRVSLRLRICPEEGARAALEAEVEEIRPHAVLQVSDNGPGLPVPTQQWKRIFETGFSTRGKGHGWGMGIIRRAVAEQGGCMTLTSTPGVGTLFELYWPLFRERPVRGGDPDSVG